MAARVAAAPTIAAKSDARRLAPPTSAPSISGWANSSAALVGVTEPPYCTRTRAATPSPHSSPTTRRMSPIVAAAPSAVAARPVPIAQTGS
jgi:hypothetical protein